MSRKYTTVTQRILWMHDLLMYNIYTMFKLDWTRAEKTPFAVYVCHTPVILKQVKVQPWYKKQ